MGYKSILFCFLFAFTDLNAQIYIQGKEVISLSSIANSTLLTVPNRLTMENAFSKYKILAPDIVNQQSRLVGEFWLFDNLFINIVSRNLMSTRKENFKELRYASGPQGASTGKHKHEYFDTIKTVNNYEAFISYYYSSNNKFFIIQDKQGRYKLSGTIISTNADKKKAEAFIDTLLNSITFK